MIQELSDESRRMGLKMNISKTKVMVVDKTPINVNNVLIENVEDCVYLGQHPGQRKYKEESWQAGRHTPNTGISTRATLPSACHEETGVQLLCAASYDINYGEETWTLTKQAQNKLAAAQTKMERSMLTRIEIPTSGSVRGQKS